jgi:hypothetical protein
MSYQLRKERKEETVELRRQVGLQLAESVPELDSREIRYGPVFPRNIRLMERRRGGIYGMREERKPAAALNCVQERGRILGVLGQLAAGAEHEEMVFLWIAPAIMDFLTGEHEYTPAARFHVTVDALDPHVVVCDQHHIHAGSDRRFSDLPMASSAVGVGGVHVQIQDDFVHRRTSGELG